MYAAGIFARPLSRQYLLSPMAQKAALRAPGLLANPEEIGLLTQGAYRVAPLPPRIEPPEQTTKESQREKCQGFPNHVIGVFHRATIAHAGFFQLGLK